MPGSSTRRRTSPPGRAPARKKPTAGLRSPGRSARLADLARYAHPRYEGAAPRAGAHPQQGRRPAEGMSSLEPVARAASRDAQARRHDERVALPACDPRSRRSSSAGSPPRRRSTATSATSGPMSSSSRRSSSLLAAGRVPEERAQARYPGGTCVASWDNLTNKGLPSGRRSRSSSGTRSSGSEASALHGVPPERVTATGAQLLRHVVRASAEHLTRGVRAPRWARSRAPYVALPRLEPVRDEPLRTRGALRRALAGGAQVRSGRARAPRGVLVGRTRSARAGAAPTSPLRGTSRSGAHTERPVLDGGAR